MGKVWTKEQLDAINARGTGMIVSAAAGSGKTAVLVERLIKILSDKENRVPADRIVVVTFTNDAANQMKQRLSEAVSRSICESPDDDWLCSQQTLLQTAKISTIHSFCFDLIRENIHLADISAGFRILDDTEEKMLKRNAVAEAFEKFYAGQPDTMKTLCDFFSDKVNGDAELEETVLDIYKYLSSMPFYRDRMKQWQENYSAGFIPEKDFFAEGYMRVMERSYKKVFDQVRYADELFFRSFGERSAVIADELAAVSGLLSKIRGDGDWDEMVECPEWKFPDMMKDLTKRLKDQLKSGEITKEEYEAAKSEQDEKKAGAAKIRDEYKKELKNISGHIFRLNEINDDYAKHSEILEKLFSLVECFDSELQRLKREKNALGFSDAEQLAVGLLAEKDGDGRIVKTPLAKELSEYYQLIMIDEFQDANDNQDLIFKMLSKGGTAEKGGTDLFMVGDVKQSIYRFRLANPKLFLNALAVSGKYTGGDFQGSNASVTLNRNFRSSSEVIGFVNYACGILMSAQVGEVDYTDQEALVQGLEYRDDEDRTTEIVIVPEEADDGSEVSESGNEEISGESAEQTEEEKLRSIIEKRAAFDRGGESADGDQEDDGENADTSGEAKAVAAKISSMLGVRMVRCNDNQDARPCEPRDFCILLRKSRFADAYVKELTALGIKARAEEPKGYLRSREISVLMSMLAVIDNPMQNIHLATVLMSPMFMLDDEDMAALAELNKDGKRYFSVIKRVLAGETEITPDSPLFIRLERFMRVFVKLRYCAASQKLERLIRTIYDSTDFLSAVQVYKDGGQKKANLRLLLEIAEGYENNSGGGISGFVRYMDAIMKRDEDLDRASTVSSGENAVSVKTIHRSKGLEYPFVFLCETSTRFRTSDSNMQINADCGIAFKIQDREQLKRYDSFPRFMISEINKTDLISEEMRLLYVALTRAREQLFITVPDSERVRKSVDAVRLRILMSGGITPDIASEARSMLDWISAAMMVHPDGEWFRGEEKLNLQESEARVRVSIFSGEAAAAEKTEETAAIPDENSVRSLEKAFAFEYADERTKQSAKITVTEISKSETGDKLDLRIPDLDMKDGLTAAERGTAMHTFMQYVNYSGIIDENYLDSEADRLADSGLLTEEERDSLDTVQLMRFFDSELYRRINSAYRKAPDMVRREQKFMIKKFDAGLLDDERLMGYNKDSMIQGIADCMFEEDGELVLVDYKTDRVSSSDTLISRYDLQIRLYAAALTRIFGKNVKEAYLYSFSLGKAVRAL